MFTLRNNEISQHFPIKPGGESFLKTALENPYSLDQLNK